MSKAKWSPSTPACLRLSKFPQAHNQFPFLPLVGTISRSTRKTPFTTTHYQSISPCIRSWLPREHNYPMCSLSQTYLVHRRRKSSRVGSSTSREEFNSPRRRPSWSRVDQETRPSRILSKSSVTPSTFPQPRVKPR
jgi:hypothetical protein